MKRKVSIEIDCGDKTCYSAPDKPCPFVRTGHYGTRWYCGLFPAATASDTLLHTTDGDGLGWLLRCKACLDAEQRP